MSRSIIAALLGIGLLSQFAYGGAVPTQVTSLVRVDGCTLADDTTLRCSGADGVGQAVFWLALADGGVVAAAYTWNVRPGAVPALVRAVYLHEGRAEPLPVALSYVWPQLRGTLSLPQGAATVDADLRTCRAVQGLTATGANVAELTPLLRGTAVRLQDAAG